MSAGKQELPPPPGKAGIFYSEKYSKPRCRPHILPVGYICFVVIWQVFLVTGEQDFPPPPGTSDIFPPGEEQRPASSSSR